MSEIEALSALEDLLEMEMNNVEEAVRQGAGYVYGLGVALIRESGSPWHRHLVLPARAADIDAESESAAALRLLRAATNGVDGYFGDLPTSLSNPEYVVARVNAPSPTRLLVWSNQDRRSSSGFTPSVLREFASRASYVVQRRLSSSKSLAVLLIEACQNRLVDEVCDLICQIDSEWNNAAILWRYDSSRRRFISLAMHGVKDAHVFDMPVTSPSLKGVAHGVVSLARPEFDYVLYDERAPEVWTPSGIRRWTVRDEGTWAANAWRSVLVMPLTSSGLLTGALSIYSRGAGKELRQRNLGLAPLLQSTLQGTLQAMDERNRLEIMERRYDEQLENAAISLKVVAHAHDLGHTVASLRKSLETLRTSAALPEMLKPEVELATTNVKRVHELSRLITDPAKPEQRRRRSRCDVAKILTEFEDYLRHIVRWMGDDKVDIHFEKADSPVGYSYVCGIDPLKLERVLDNLVNNAVYWCKTAKPRGHITVRVSPAPLVSSSEGVLLEVEDNGTGIDPQIRPFIFDRFRTKRGPDEGEGQGMGLGLYLSRRDVLQAGGRISVQSVPGKTVFSVLLPVEPAGRGRA